MKKIFFLLMLSSVICAYSQRQEGGIAFQGRFGIMDGKGTMNNFFGLSKENKASFASAGMSMLLGDEGLYSFDANLIAKDMTIIHDDINQRLPIRVYGLEALGGYSFEDFEPLFINLKGGGFVGYQVVNKGETKSALYGSQINNTKGIVYGAVISPELELIIWQNLGILVSFNQYYYINNKWLKFNYSVNLGLKYYL